MIDLGLETEKMSFTVNGKEAIEKANSLLDSAVSSVSGS